MIENELQRSKAFHSWFMRNFPERLWHCAAGSLVCAPQEALSAPILPILKPLCYEANMAESEMGSMGKLSKQNRGDGNARAGAWRQSQESRSWGCSIYPHIPGRRRLTPPTRVAWGPERTLTFVLLNAMLITSFFYSLVTSGYRIGVVSAAQAPPPRLFAYVADALDLHRQLLQLVSFGMGFSRLKQQRYSGSYLFGCAPL